MKGKGSHGSFHFPCLVCFQGILFTGHVLGGFGKWKLSMGVVPCFEGALCFYVAKGSQKETTLFLVYMSNGLFFGGSTKYFETNPHVTTKVFKQPASGFQELDESIRSG